MAAESPLCDLMAPNGGKPSARAQARGPARRLGLVAVLLAAVMISGCASAPLARTAWTSGVPSGGITELELTESGRFLAALSTTEGAVFVYPLAPYREEVDLEQFGSWQPVRLSFEPIGEGTPLEIAAFSQAGRAESILTRYVLDANGQVVTNHTVSGGGRIISLGVGEVLYEEPLGDEALALFEASRPDALSEEERLRVREELRRLRENTAGMAAAAASIPPTDRIAAGAVWQNEDYRLAFVAPDRATGILVFEVSGRGQAEFRTSLPAGNVSDLRVDPQRGILYAAEVRPPGLIAFDLNSDAWGLR